MCTGIFLITLYNFYKQTELCKQPQHVEESPDILRAVLPSSLAALEAAQSDKDSRRSTFPCTPFARADSSQDVWRQQQISYASLVCDSSVASSKKAVVFLSASFCFTYGCIKKENESGRGNASFSRKACSRMEALCLVCKETVAVMKDYKEVLYYRTHFKLQYDLGHFWSEKLQQLKILNFRSAHFCSRGYCVSPSALSHCGKKLQNAEIHSLTGNL
jgi:hypothetical protein